jgi:orotidine-5'-phosphate decarboxylase
MSTFEKLQKAIALNDSILCIGLDIDSAMVPDSFSDISTLISFNKEIIDHTKDLACSYKINFAFYEQYGLKGWELLEQTISYIPEEIVIISDAKRGDIGNTSVRYARAVYDTLRTDAVTINPFMGLDSAQPFITGGYEDKMAFVLALTSNPGSADFQRLGSEGRSISKHVIDKFYSNFNHHSIGFVIGATHPDELAEIRETIPDSFLLIPGVGTQGGNIEAVMKANKGLPAIVNVSRDIIYSSKGHDFALKARDKALYYREILR